MWLKGPFIWISVKSNLVYPVAKKPTISDVTKLISRKNLIGRKILQFLHCAPWSMKLGGFYVKSIFDSFVLHSPKLTSHKIWKISVFGQYSNVSWNLGHGNCSPLVRSRNRCFILVPTYFIHTCWSHCGNFNQRFTINHVKILHMDFKPKKF